MKLSNTVMKLSDTVELMNSEDYKERFKAEYLQLAIRTEKLHELLIKMKAGKLDFEPKTDYETLFLQFVRMSDYMNTLIHRADIEGIDLSEGEFDE